MRADSRALVSASTQLLTVAEVAHRLAVSIRTVRTLIALGKLPIVRVGARAIRVDAADLATFIAARRVAS